MKLMTYNILNGGEDRLDLIIDIINGESPDYLTINEANTFAAENNKILKKFADQTGFEYFDLALSGEFDYHVAVFSKYPFKKVNKLQPLMRACIVAQVTTELGDISIASLHLTPYTEDLRHPEIDLIVDYQSEFKQRILTGDLNSLSADDGYNAEVIKNFNDTQIKRFTKGGNLRFDAISKVLVNGYTDSAVNLGKNQEYTAPTTIYEYPVRFNMRLDYVFLSRPLLPYLRKYKVVKNKLTDKASDHYPVVVELHQLRN